MGIGFDTSETMEFVLSQHKALLKEKQPVLVFRFLTVREANQMEKAIEEARKEGDISKMIAACKVGLVNWKNFSVPFNADDLDAIYCAGDVIELYESLAYMQTIELMKLKKSVAQSLLSTDKPAGPAEVPVQTS